MLIFEGYKRRSFKSLYRQRCTQGDIICQVSRLINQLINQSITHPERHGTYRLIAMQLPRAPTGVHDADEHVAHAGGWGESVLMCHGRDRLSNRIRFDEHLYVPQFSHIELFLSRFS